MLPHAVRIFIVPPFMNGGIPGMMQCASENSDGVWRNFFFKYISCVCSCIIHSVSWI